MPWIDGDDDEHLTTSVAVPQNDMRQPWWRMQRRRSRSPLYSEPSHVCEPPELLVEPESSIQSDLSEEMAELLRLISDVMRDNKSAQHYLRLRPSDVANVTIRKKFKTKGRNRRRYKRVRFFRVYQFCNCPNHVCPNPNLF